MNKFSPGTLVMTKVAGPEARSWNLRVGHIGCVIETPPDDNSFVGNILVDFPGTTLPPHFKYWQCAPNDLIIISDPDADIDDSVDTKIDKYFEEHA